MKLGTTLFRHLFTLLFILATPFIVLRLIIRSRKQPDYRKRILERFGFIKPTNKPSIWIHSDSVGESIAAKPLVLKLLEQYPQYNIHITTTTPTGSKQVLDQYGNQVTHSYLPYDIPCLIKRSIKRIQPKLIIIMETEIWPNLLYCAQQAAPTLLANGRLSEKSCLAYAKLGRVAADIFNLFTTIAAQSTLDADHFKQVGTDAHKLQVTGSIKFDHDLPVDIKNKATQLREQWQLENRPVFIAASTRDGEETYILDAFKHIKAKHPEAFLLLVPRHTERATQLLKQINAAGLTAVRRSELTNTRPDCDIILGDTIGELMLLYALADIAYVGGSLVNTGCHNVLEPAALSMPIITGPSLRNFKTITALLIHEGAQTVVHNANELANAVNQLIEHPELAKERGDIALRVYNSNKGATQKHLKIIANLLAIEEYCDQSSTSLDSD